MTKQEMLARTEEALEAQFEKTRNRVKALIEEAWEEGKASAGTEKAEEFAREIVEQVKKSIIVPYEMKLPGVPQGENPDWRSLANSLPNSFFSDACKRCANNPANGGSGICHCILGTSPITC